MIQHVSIICKSIVNDIGSRARAKTRPQGILKEATPTRSRVTTKEQPMPIRQRVSMKEPTPEGRFTKKAAPRGILKEPTPPTRATKPSRIMSECTPEMRVTKKVTSRSVVKEPTPPTRVTKPSRIMSESTPEGRFTKKVTPRSVVKEPAPPMRVTKNATPEVRTAKKTGPTKLMRESTPEVRVTTNTGSGAGTARHPRTGVVAVKPPSPSLATTRRSSVPAKAPVPTQNPRPTPSSAAMVKKQDPQSKPQTKPKEDPPKKEPRQIKLDRLPTAEALQRERDRQHWEKKALRESDPSRPKPLKHQIVNYGKYLDLGPEDVSEENRNLSIFNVGMQPEDSSDEDSGTNF